MVFCHGVMVGMQTLLRRREAGQVGDISDVAVSALDEVRDPLKDGFIVGDSDAVAVKGQIRQSPVDKHHGEALRQYLPDPLTVGEGAGDDKPVHDAGGEESDAVQLPLLILLSVCDDEMKALCSKICLDFIDDHRPEVV